MQYIYTQNFPKALESFNKIVERSSLRSTVHYYAAIAYAINSDTENAIDQLRQAVEKGFATKAGLKNPVFNSIPDERLREIEIKIENNAVIAITEFEKIKSNYSYTFDVHNLPKEVQLGPSMSRPKAQGSRNTCSAFAATALAESVVKKELNKDLDLSEQYAYYIAKTKTLKNEFLSNGYGKSRAWDFS